LTALRRNDAASAAIKVPSLIVHGGDDSLLPVAGSSAAYRHLCSLHTSTRLRIYTSSNHMDIPRTSAPYVVRWMEDRLAGRRLKGCAQSHVA
jgi:pimeloyl-ACP methyl ester carboxylesterase